MDSTHARDLRRLAPDAEVVLMRAFDPALDADADDLDVPDPYYGSTRDFEDVLAMIEAANPARSPASASCSPAIPSMRDDDA